ncbi:MAG: inorganic pyrophosphatase [bacterium]|nr:inorganic pyrophosphatase [bacterium]
MNNNKYLGQNLKVILDRPKRSLHPKYKYEYPVNYGYIPDTVSGDGEELDAYVLGIDIPLKEFYGKCIAIIHRLEDDDDKLIVVPEDKIDISDDYIITQIHFQEQYFRSEMIRNL